MSDSHSIKDHEILLHENGELRSKLKEAEETLNAIRNGEVDAIVVTGKEGEKVFSLSSAETPYRIILEEMNEGAVIVSKNGLILYCNKSFSVIMGVPHEQVTGSEITTFIDNGDRARFNKLLRTSLKKSTKGVISCVNNRSRLLYAQFSFVALPPNLEGDVCIVVSDITKIKDYQNSLQEIVNKRTTELEEANRQLSDDLSKLERNKLALHRSTQKYRLLYNKMCESEAKYKDLVEHSRSLILRQDTSGKIIFFNEYAEELFGFAKEEVIGKSPVGLFVPEIESSGRNLEEIASGCI